MARRLILQKIALAAAAAFVLASAAQAEALPDPTRPPSGFVETVGSGGAGAGPVAKEAPSGGAAAPAGGPQLQSVVLPQDGRGRPVAIISGKYVPQGERFAGMELIEVTEQQVVLAAGKKRRVLKLTPGIEKTPSGDPKPKAPLTRPAVGKQEIQSARREDSNE